MSIVKESYAGIKRHVYELGSPVYYYLSGFMTLLM
jgi:hypothetical protein